jgi:hypothetical protein
MSQALRLSTLLLCALALAGCGDKPAPGTAAGTPGVTPGPPAANATAGSAAADLPPLPELGDFRIAGLLLGTGVDGDNVVTTDRETFAPKDAIHATVLTVGKHPGLHLQATWVAPDGSTIARTDQPIAPEGPSATTFHISNPDGWPVGGYELRLAINGHPLQGRKFEVKQ